MVFPVSFLIKIYSILRYINLPSLKANTEFSPVMSPCVFTDNRWKCSQRLFTFCCTEYHNYSVAVFTQFESLGGNNRFVNNFKGKLSDRKPVLTTHRASFVVFIAQCLFYKRGSWDGKLDG